MDGMNVMTVFPDSEGCPEGMYGLEDVHEPYMLTDFGEWQEHAKGMSSVLNLPIAYFFDTEQDYVDLIFLMPRKMQGCALRLMSPDREQVLAWLDEWLPGEIATWFGWEMRP